MLEEDNAKPPMRCFQLVAPDGRVWFGTGTKHVRVDIDSQRQRHAMEWNVEEVERAVGIVSKGNRTMTEAEAYECDEVPA